MKLQDGIKFFLTYSQGNELFSEPPKCFIAFENIVFSVMHISM